MSNKGNKRSFSAGSREKLPKYLEKEEIEKILNRTKENNRIHYLILLVMWRTGGRCIDITQMKKENVKPDEIFFRNSKGGVDRIVPIESHVYDLLSYHMTHMRYNERLFPMSKSNIRKFLKNYVGDKKWVHPHTFRHSFAVYALKNGLNIRALQKILGHKSLETTAVYLDLIAEDVKSEYNKIPW